MDTIIKVSNAAFRIGGSQVWLDPRESFSLEELLITIMVKSANDSSYLVGEYIENGDMDQFITRMNTRAAELNMTDTEFLNAHGLPEGATGNTASCRDLVRLALALYRFPQALRVGFRSYLQISFRFGRAHHTRQSQSLGIDDQRREWTENRLHEGRGILRYRHL